MHQPQRLRFAIALLNFAIVLDCQFYALRFWQAVRVCALIYQLLNQLDCIAATNARQMYCSNGLYCALMIRLIPFV